MAYIVNLTNNNIVATVVDGAIDTSSTSITLLGKGFNNYGELVAENFVHMLEHFALPTPPLKPLRGQMWFNTSTNSMMMNISTDPNTPQWVECGKAIVSATQPSTGQFGVGSFWYNTSDNVLNIAVDPNTFVRLKTVKTDTTLPSPNSGEAGDLFYESTNTELKILNPNFKERGILGWEQVGIKVSATAPTTLDEGDLWYDINNKQVKVFTDDDANNALIVGPLFPESSSSTIEEANDASNPMVGFIINGEGMALMVSSDGPNTNPAYSNVGSPVKKGLNVNGSVSIVSSSGPSTWYTGSGDPNGSVSATVGCLYTRVDGTPGSTFYVKESGTGNTGWVAK